MINEHKKGFKAKAYPKKPKVVVEPPKPRNPVAKNATAAIGGGAAGAHKDKKKDAKQGKTKHKKAELAENIGEGDTLKNSLHTIIRVATHLDKALDRNDNFPEWVSEKIGATKELMVGVMDYIISSQEMQHDPDAMREAANPAQQAAIAIAKKKKKSVAESAGYESRLASLLEGAITELDDTTKASYKEKATKQVKDLEPHAKKGEYKDIAKRMIDRRQKGLARTK